MDLWFQRFIPLMARLKAVEEMLPRPGSVEDRLRSLEMRIVRPELQGSLDQIIYDAILAAVDRCGSIKGAARALQVDEHTVRNRLRKAETGERPWGKLGRPGKHIK